MATTTQEIQYGVFGKKNDGTWQIAHTFRSGTTLEAAEGCAKYKKWLEHIGVSEYKIVQRTVTITTEDWIDTKGE